MPAAARLTFGRVSTTYVVPRGTPAPDDVRRRGDAVLREHLFAALAPVLERMLPRNDETVWIIRRLDLDFPFALEQQSLAVLGETWAAELTRGLVRALRGGENVTRFPSRAAFLAQFVFDAALGRDAGCWYYACFDSLRALPRSAMIREALVREPDEALPVLLELARTRRLDAVLGALHDAGARAIYETAFPVATPVLAPSPRMIETLLALCEKPSPRDALRLAVTLCTDTGVAAADIRTHVDRTIEFTSLLASLDEPWRLIELLLDGDLAAAALLAPHAIDTLQFFAVLGETRPEVLTCTASTVVASSPAVRNDAVLSRFAGLAMLLPDLECESAELRARIAVECAMGARDVLSDPIIELFRGDAENDDELPDERDAAELATELMQKFASRLFGFAGSSLPYIYANFLEGFGSIRMWSAATPVAAVSPSNEILVELPPVPLEVILHLAGMHERRFTVPWLPDKTIVLRLGGRA
jgi:hypothetical protein